MAEALVSFVLEKTRDAIWQKLEEEAKLVLGVDKQVKNLTTTLLSLQVLLKDADLKQVNDADIKAWLEELKDIVYDADDVLDEWRTKFLLSQLNPITPTFTEKIMYYLFSPCSSHIPASCSCFIPDDLPQHHRIATEIQGINERLDPINRDTIRNRLDRLPTTQSHHGRVTSPEVIVAEIHGRDGDKEIIVDWLHGDHSSCTSVPVLSIVGTGGFGKTTLAQIVFDQEKTRFEPAIWVCVSDPFDREKVAKKIIQGATDSDDWEVLHQQLSNSIKGKRFLIVLDDVWAEDPEDWEPFRISLNGGAQGSRVIVTTRNEKVAMMMGSSETHRLGGLSNQDCWLLFQQIAFAKKEERETLKEIGEEIVAKCKGVPLAVKTIAGLMRSKHTKDEWNVVLKSDIWKLKQGKHGFLPSLLLSYHDLTPDLKQCFLYCAIFLKDATIEKDVLVKLWMAQGFLGLDGDEELETTGEEYFDELAMRSFFQDFEHDDEGKIIACKMHDLVHDFAEFLTKTECSILENSDTVLDSEKLRHTNAGHIDIESLSGFKVKKLRSLILKRSKTIHSEFFCHLPCLRSLNLNHSGIEKLPDEVERLLHLRYLDLSNTKLTELPETMCNLYNLQTLKLNSCNSLCKLPEGIGGLLNLRHLELEDTFKRIYFPQGIGKLKHLRTLHKFVVSNASGGCKLEELEDLNLISGKLQIRGLRQVENSDEARRAELQEKVNIVSLTLDFIEESEENENNMKKRMEEIIEGLQPHNNLEHLKIRAYPGLAFPSWMSTMSNIIELKLINCLKLEALPATISKLPSLVRLRLEGMCWSDDILGICGFVNEESMPLFPKLTTLQLENMGEWEEEIHEQTIAPTISIMPNLRFLRISWCPKLKVIPNYLFSHNLKELKINYCLKLEALPAMISKLPSLDRLELSGMRWSDDMLGICGFVNGESMSLFPKLTSLDLISMNEWEEEIHGQTMAPTISIMPNLRFLSIRWCRKLKVIPNYLFSHNLKELVIINCRELIRMPSLESLDLIGDVPIINGSNNNHNLKSFYLWNSPQSSLPQGLNHFKSLQELDICFCPSIDFNPEEELSSEHFPNLRKLTIIGCGDLTRERCSSVNWSNLSHISEIKVDGTLIRANRNN